MFRDLRIPTPNSLVELEAMRDVIHGDHFSVEASKMDPDFAYDLRAKTGWDDIELAMFQASRFIYLEGDDQLSHKRKILEILQKIEYEDPDQKGTDLTTFRIVERDSKKDLVEVSLQKYSFSVKDRPGLPRFSFTAKCNRYDPNYPNNSVMTADAVLVHGSDRNPYMPHMRTLMGLALSYFKRNGISVGEFWADWDPTYSEATNYKIYQRGIDEAKTPEEAAFATPTGRVLKRFGFKSVHVPDPNWIGSITPIFSR